ncbi:hypothetical protein Tco_0246409 [Tanacetum coccineum]
MKDKMVYKWNNVAGALMNVPIFVGTFSIMTDFAVLEDMDVYCDEGIGDVIFGETFLSEAGIKTKRFKGRITIYNGDDKVTDNQKRTRERMSDQEAKEIKAEARKIMPQLSTKSTAAKPQSTKPNSIVL